MNRSMYIYCHRRIQFIVNAPIETEEALGREWDKMKEIEQRARHILRQ